MLYLLGCRRENRLGYTYRMTSFYMESTSSGWLVGQPVAIKSGQIEEVGRLGIVSYGTAYYGVVKTFSLGTINFLNAIEPSNIGV